MLKLDTNYGFHELFLKQTTLMTSSTDIQAKMSSIIKQPSYNSPI